MKGISSVVVMLMALLMPAMVWTQTITPELKARARKIAGDFTALADRADAFQRDFGPDAEVAAIGRNSRRQQSEMAAEFQKVAALSSAPNQPNPNFDTIATLDNPVTFKMESGTAISDLAAHRNTSLKFAGEFIDNLTLLNLSLRKFYGALSAGDTARAQFQKDAACQFLREAQTSLSKYSDSLTTISLDVQGTRFAPLSATVAELIALRNDIAGNGFPPDELAIFRDELHFTTNEIDQAKNELLALSDVDIASLGPASGATVFANAASILQQLDIRASLPQGFTCPNSAPPVVAPTLSEWGVIIMGFLLVTAGMAFIVRRRSAMAEAGATPDGARLDAGMNRPLLVTNVFIKVLAGILALVLVGFAAVNWLSGPIKLLDIGGTLLSALVFAYVVHLLMLAAKDSQTNRG